MSGISWREELASRWAGGLGPECSICGRDLSTPQNTGYFELHGGGVYVTCEPCYAKETSTKKHLLYARGCKAARFLDCRGRELARRKILAQSPWIEEF